MAYSVKDYQSLLAKSGYNVGPIDGIYGNQTRAAVIKYQKDNGLSPDGIVGDKTWGSLTGSTKQPTLFSNKSTSTTAPTNTVVTGQPTNTRPAKDKTGIGGLLDNIYGDKKPDDTSKGGINGIIDIVKGAGKDLLEYVKDVAHFEPGKSDPNSSPFIQPKTDQPTTDTGTVTTPPVDPRKDYIDTYLSGTETKDEWMGEAKTLAEQQASLQYDNQVARIKQLAAKAKMQADNELDQIGTQYGEMYGNIENQSYQRKSQIEQLLSSMGMLNTGAHVGNEQMISRDKDSQMNKVGLEHGNAILANRRAYDLADFNEQTDMDQLANLKDTFIAHELGLANKDYRKYVEDKTQHAEDNWYKDQDFKLRTDQFDYAKTRDTAQDAFRDKDWERAGEWHEGDVQFREDQQKHAEEMDKLNYNLNVKKTDAEITAEKRDYDLKLKSFNHEVEMDKQNLALKKQEIANAYRASQQRFSSEMRDYYKDANLDLNAQKALNYENGRVDKQIEGAIAGGNAKLAAYYINTSNLPPNVKSAKLNQLTKSFGWSQKEMGVSNKLTTQDNAFWKIENGYGKG